MKILRNFSSAMILLIIIGTVVFAGTKLNFTGTWALDATRSEGLPPGMDQVMIVEQTDNKISLVTKLITPQGEQAVSDSYLVNGEETDFTPQSPNGNGKGKRLAKWLENGIEVNESAQFDGDIKVEIKRRWKLSADGKELQIEINVNGPQGAQTVKRTFVKKS